MTDITIERCREHVAKCEEKGKFDDKARAIQFLLAKLDAAFDDEGDRELTIEGGERWLNKWHDVPLARFPHAVKLLFLYSQELHWYKGQRERYLEDMRRIESEAVALSMAIKHQREQTLSEKVNYDQEKEQA